MPIKFRMVFVSILENEPDQLRKLANELGEEMGIEVDFYGIYGDDADEDLLVYHELVRRTKEADYIYVRCMGDINRFHNWERYEAVLKEVRGFPVVLSGNPDINMMTRELFRGNDEEYKEIYSYATDRCPENDKGVIWWGMHKLGYTTKKPNPPVSHRLHGIYHKGMSLDITKEDYLKTLDPDKITIGYVFASFNWIYGTFEHIDPLIEEIERQGMNVIPIFCSGYSRDLEEGIPGVLREYFEQDGKPLVSAIIASNRLTIEDPEHDRCLDEWNFYRRELNVPLIFALAVQGKYHDFEDDKIGLSKRDMQMNVIYPELEGAIIGVPVAYKVRGEGITRMLPIPDRIEHIVRLANPSCHGSVGNLCDSQPGKQQENADPYQTIHPSADVRTYGHARNRIQKNPDGAYNERKQRRSRPGHEQQYWHRPQQSNMQQSHFALNSDHIGQNKHKQTT